MIVLNNIFLIELKNINFILYLKLNLFYIYKEKLKKVNWYLIKKNFLC